MQSSPARPEARKSSRWPRWSARSRVPASCWSRWRPSGSTSSTPTSAAAATKSRIPSPPARRPRAPWRKSATASTGFSAGAGWPPPRAVNCYAGYALIDEDKALPVPDGVDDFTAAALPLQGITAHYLINSSFKVEPGHTVLLHAGAGGVGLLLIQLLKARGARVITTVSTDDKEQLARDAGADHVLRYEGFAARVRELTDGTGADVVYDGVGKDTFDGSLAALRIRGTPGALRCRFRAGAAGRPAAAQRRRLAVPDPADASATSCATPRNAAGAPTRSSRQWPTAASRSGSAPAMTWPKPRRPTRTSKARRTTGKVILVP